MIKGGHRVTALARDPEKAERLQAGAPPRYRRARTPENLRQRREGRRCGRAHGPSSRRPAASRRRSSRSISCSARWREASQADGKPRVFIYTSGVWVLGRSVKSAEEDAPLDPPPYVEWRPAHEEKVLSAFFGFAPHRGRPARHRLWRRPRHRRRSDQGRAERPDPGRRPRQESLAVHLRSRSRPSST